MSKIIPASVAIESYNNRLEQEKLRRENRHKRVVQSIKAKLDKKLQEIPEYIEEMVGDGRELTYMTMKGVYYSDTEHLNALKDLLYKYPITKELIAAGYRVSVTNSRYDQYISIRIEVK